MRKGFVRYLEDIGMTKKLIGRVKEVYDFYEKLVPGEIEAVFVTDYLTSEGTREYENLWFFSKKQCVEAKNFLTTDDFDMDSIIGTIYAWNIEKKDYDFKNATAKSRFNLIFYMVNLRTGHLKASTKNCQYLKHIFLKYILPNLQ